MIEVARGGGTGSVADELLAFWATQGALSPADARRRLAEVVCVLRVDHQMAGVSSAYPAVLAAIGGRRFWIYRELLPGGAAVHQDAMIGATFSTLQAEFDGSPGSPIGLCVLIADSVQRRRRPEAEWSDPQTIYAGYLADGRQLRIAYFDGALIGPAVRND